MRTPAPTRLRAATQSPTLSLSVVLGPNSKLAISAAVTSGRVKEDTILQAAASTAYSRAHNHATSEIFHPANFYFSSCKNSVTNPFAP